MTLKPREHERYQTSETESTNVRMVLMLLNRMNDTPFVRTVRLDLRVRRLHMTRKCVPGIRAICQL